MTRRTNRDDNNIDVDEIQLEVLDRLVSFDLEAIHKDVSSHDFMQPDNQSTPRSFAETLRNGDESSALNLNQPGGPPSGKNLTGYTLEPPTGNQLYISFGGEAPTTKSGTLIEEETREVPTNMPPSPDNSQAALRQKLDEIRKAEAVLKGLDEMPVD